MRSIRIVSSAAIFAMALLAGCQSESGQWKWPWQSSSNDQQGTMADKSQSTWKDVPRDNTGAYDSSARTAGQTVSPDYSQQRYSPATQPTGMNDLSTQAQQLIDQTQQYIHDGNYSMADQTLAKLDQFKSQLPQSYQTRIDSLRSTLNTAKQGQNLMGR
ncbi:MAG TPA: hypothetical protein VH518_23710 [Tepidisphaeraceae bacterium]|jgi:outer membrane murein-binding lipoprotein Lpp